MQMERYFGALTLTLLLAIILIRVLLLRRRGIQAMQFGRTDKTDFLIPPFALFYFYIVIAVAFDWPTFARHRYFESQLASWAGGLCCVAGLILLSLSLVSFGKSFRIGIDKDSPDDLVTTGVFGVSRNPIYEAFWFVLLGQFLLFPNLVPLIYLIAATGLFHRQVLREEDFMQRHYGPEYSAYRRRVRRYL
jgi:protein-S-isoprenylcysteine O-methyltransferase Ste14